MIILRHDNYTGLSLIRFQHAIIEAATKFNTTEDWAYDLISFTSIVHNITCLSHDGAVVSQDLTLFLPARDRHINEDTAVGVQMQQTTRYSLNNWK